MNRCRVEDCEVDYMATNVKLVGLSVRVLMEGKFSGCIGITFLAGKNSSTLHQRVMLYPFSQALPLLGWKPPSG